MQHTTHPAKNEPTPTTSDSLFYSEANLDHLRAGIATLNSGLGVEHELIEE